MRVLFVCTANTCRSPSAERLMRDAIAHAPELSGRVEIRSTGTHAVGGAPGCSLAAPLARHWEQHRSVPLSRQHTAWADLILPLAREHRGTVTGLDPRARSRTLTLREAGRSAQWLVDTGTSLTARGLVTHLNAARGHAGPGQPGMLPAPVSAQAGAGRTRWAVTRRRPDPVQEHVHPDDIPDPHVLGTQWHPVAAEQIAQAVDALVAAMRVAQ